MPQLVDARPGDQACRHWHFSPLALTGVLIAFILGLAATGALLTSWAQPATPNLHCTLTVPANPLTAQGLATPYLLKATNPGNGPCHEANPMQAAFVQAAVVNPHTGSISVYDPLVIDQGTQPAVKPVVPVIPEGSIVGIWFGFNGMVLTLQGTHGNTLTMNHCVNGIPGSPFGQFAYCNAVNFFEAANMAIRAGEITPPPLGRDRMGLTCPSVRDFSFVDQDQSDNVTTVYLVTPNGRIAQNTSANRRAFPNAMRLTNPSDNRLLIGVDRALGCPPPWRRPNLADPGYLTTALPLNELQAAFHQPPPVALVPANDPMVMVAKDNTFVPNLTKLNLYRVGVDQPRVNSLEDASTREYCIHLQQIAPPRLSIDAPLLGQGATPDAAVGNTLFTFMAQRYVNTFTNPLGVGLNCMMMFHLQPMVKTLKNPQGVAVAVQITVNGQTRCFNARGMVSPLNTCTSF